MSSESSAKALLIGPDAYAMDACVRLGIDAVVVLGAKFRDRGLVHVPDQLRMLPVDDQSNVECVLSALIRAGLGKENWAGVYMMHEQAFVAAALLAEHFGCAVNSPETAVLFRDKAAQKAALAAAGVRVPRFTVIDDIHDVSSIDELPFPKAVLKPIAGAGTTLTSVVADVGDLRARSREYAAKRLPQRTFILEEFAGGDEWIIDGVVYNGEILFYTVSTYGEPCLATVDKGQALTMRRFDPELDKPIYDKAKPLAQDALTALGLQNSVFHLEAFHDPETGQLTFSECAARRGGSCTHEEVEAKFNVNLGESGLLCAMGMRPQLNVKNRPVTVGMGYLATQPGILIQCPTPDELMALPGVEFARIEQPYGARFPAGVADTTQKIGLAMLAVDSPEEFDRRLPEVRAWFDERVVTVPEGAQPRELRAWQRRTWPDLDFGDRLWR